MGTLSVMLIRAIRAIAICCQSAVRRWILSVSVTTTEHGTQDKRSKAGIADFGMSEKTLSNGLNLRSADFESGKRGSSRGRTEGFRIENSGVGAGM
jgi:hypothetical protein